MNPRAERILRLLSIGLVALSAPPMLLVVWGAFMLVGQECTPTSTRHSYGEAFEIVAVVLAAYAIPLSATISFLRAKPPKLWQRLCALATAQLALGLALGALLFLAIGTLC